MGAECVGLDIGSSSIKAVVLERRRGSQETHLSSFGIEPLPPQTIVDGMIMDQSAVVAAIVRLTTALGIKRRAAATAISGHSVLVKKLQLASVGRDELAEQIPIEVEQNFPFKRDEVDIDYQIVKPRNAQGRMDVILVAAKKEIIADYMQVIREAKLHPAVLDVAAFSIQNAFEASYGEEATRGNIGLIHIGHAITHVNIVSDGVSVFARDVTVGGAAFTEEIQRRLTVTEEIAEGYKLAAGDGANASTVPTSVSGILNEMSVTSAAKLQRSLDFFLASAPEFALSKIYLSGGSAHVVGLVAALAARSKIPVELLNPFRRTIVDTRRLDGLFVKAHAAEAAVAYGLALRRAQDSPA